VSGRDVGARVRARFKRFGLSASVGQNPALVAYIGLLTKWNKTVNLTSLELDPLSDKSIDRLLVEPVVAAKFIEQRSPGWKNVPLPRLTLLDIGSGGGSPAIPLKIVMPGLHLMMVEAKVRKSAFLREAIRQLGLFDAEVLNARLEELLPRPDLNEAADLVSMRAVRADQRLWKTVSAFAKPGAAVLWFRSHGDRAQDAVFFPSFMLEAVETLVTADGSELAILRKPGEIPAQLETR
jgi:16S rRNA (guanine527-N7)-methyltransferase